jgi:hypothetical protein
MSVKTLCTTYDSHKPSATACCANENNSYQPTHLYGERCRQLEHDVLAEHIRGQHLAGALLGVEEMGQSITQMKHSPSYAQISAPSSPPSSSHSSRMPPRAMVYAPTRISHSWSSNSCSGSTPGSGAFPLPLPFRLSGSVPFRWRLDGPGRKGGVKNGTGSVCRCVTTESGRVGMRVGRPASEQGGGRGMGSRGGMVFQTFRAYPV